MKEDVCVLDEDQICMFLLNGYLEIGTQGLTLVYQEDEDRPVSLKKIVAIPKGSHHAIVPAAVAKKFETVILIPTRKTERKGTRKKQVFEGRTARFDGADLQIILTARGYELGDAGIDLIFQEKGTRPIVEKDVARYSKRGFRAIVPIEIAREYERVFIIPGRRIFGETWDSEEARKLLELEDEKEEKEFAKQAIDLHGDKEETD